MFLTTATMKAIMFFNIFMFMFCNKTRAYQSFWIHFFYSLPGKIANKKSQTDNSNLSGWKFIRRGNLKKNIVFEDKC